MKNAALVLIGLTIFVFLVVSCSDDSAVNGDEQNPELLRILPEDGSSSVSTETSIHLVFNMPMDTQSIRMYMYFSGGESMHEWMDSLEHYGGMGNLNMSRMNHMQNWIDSIEWGGMFHWNGKFDSCEFMPDSALYPGTDYMIYIYGDVRGSDGRRMNMGHLPHDGYLNTFTTAGP